MAKKSVRTELVILGSVLTSTYASGAAAAVDYEWLLTSSRLGAASVTVSSPPVGQPFSLQGINAINNSGMSSTVFPTDTHSVLGADMWESSPNDPDPYFTIDLKDVHPIGKMLIWNYAAYVPNWGYFSGRGIKDCFIWYSADGFGWNILKGPGANDTFTLAMGSVASPPNGTPPEQRRDAATSEIDFGGKPARYVSIRPVVGAGTCQSGAPCGNWGGVLGEADKYYGLSEVRVYRYGRQTTAHTFIAARVAGASSNAGDAYPNKTTSNFGMSDAFGANFTDTATVENNSSKWITADGDSKPWIMFDLGGTYPIESMAVWYLNVNKLGQDWTNKGLRQIEIWYSISNVYNGWEVDPLKSMTAEHSPWKPLRTEILHKATGGDTQATTDLIYFGNARARYVMIIPTGGVTVGNHGGSSYGLSQVRFFAGTGLGAEPAPHWEALFGQRSTTASVYTYGDGAYSTKYTIGGKTRSLFIFDDPSCGTWDPITYAPNAGICAHNSYATYTDGPTLTPSLKSTVVDNDFSNHTIRPAERRWPGTEFYWIAGGYQDGSNIFLGGLRKEAVEVPAPTAEDPNHTKTKIYMRSFDIIRVPLLTDGTPRYDLANLPSNQFVTPFGIYPNNPPNDPVLPETGFPSQMVKFGTLVYVYGWKGTPAHAELIVGRFSPQHYNTFTSQSSWRFYDGTWNNKDVSKAINILRDGLLSGTWGSVTAAPSGWGFPYMYTTSPIMDGDVQPVSVAFAQNPWGPFGPYTPLFTPGPSLFAPTHGGDPNVFPGDFYYASSAHPEISPVGEAIVSTNLQPRPFGIATEGAPKFYRARMF